MQLLTNSNVYFYFTFYSTDEQAPIPDVFDQLVERLLILSNHGDPLFNCQMGRGRTTTGMVITCLMEMILDNGSVIENCNTLLLQETRPSSPSSFQNLILDDDDDARSLVSRYLIGDYSIIQNLIAVLSYGKIAKFLTDRAIDACNHIQNLRTCILDYRKRLSNLIPGTQKYEIAFEGVWNYLVRYFYLIT
jgi:hypothetical protein